MVESFNSTFFTIFPATVPITPVWKKAHMRRIFVSCLSIPTTPYRFLTIWLRLWVSSLCHAQKNVRRNLCSSQQSLSSDVRELCPHVPTLSSKLFRRPLCHFRQPFHFGHSSKDVPAGLYRHASKTGHVNTLSEARGAQPVSLHLWLHSHSRWLPR